MIFGWVTFDPTIERISDQIHVSLFLVQLQEDEGLLSFEPQIRQHGMQKSSTFGSCNLPVPARFAINSFLSRPVDVSTVTVTEPVHQRLECIGHLNYRGSVLLALVSLASLKSNRPFAVENTSNVSQSEQVPGRTRRDTILMHCGSNLRSASPRPYQRCGGTRISIIPVASVNAGRMSGVDPTFEKRRKSKK